MNPQTQDRWIKGYPTSLPAYIIRAITSTIELWHAYQDGPIEWWQPAKLPEPPKKEMTRSEIDTAAYIERYGTKPTQCYNVKSGWYYDSDVWHAALAYERREIKALLDLLSTDSHYGNLDFLNDIKARIQS